MFDDGRPVSTGSTVQGHSPGIRKRRVLTDLTGELALRGKGPSQP